MLGLCYLGVVAADAGVTHKVFVARRCCCSEVLLFRCVVVQRCCYSEVLLLRGVAADAGVIPKLLLLRGVVNQRCCC